MGTLCNEYPDRNSGSNAGLSDGENGILCRLIGGVFDLNFLLKAFKNWRPTFY